jgi:predicted AAA+ superfamily ATPase
LLVAESLAGRVPSFDMSPFSPQRFAAATDDATGV